MKTSVSQQEVKIAIICDYNCKCENNYLWFLKKVTSKNNICFHFVLQFIHPKNGDSKKGIRPFGSWNVSVDLKT